MFHTQKNLKYRENFPIVFLEREARSTTTQFSICNSILVPTSYLDNIFACFFTKFQSSSLASRQAGSHNKYCDKRVSSPNRKFGF